MNDFGIVLYFLIGLVLVSLFFGLGALYDYFVDKRKRVLHFSNGVCDCGNNNDNNSSMGNIHR